MTVNAADWIRAATALGSHLMRTAPEAASQTFKKGAPLVASSGYLTEATSGAALDIIGFALTDGHNGDSNGDYDIDYIPVDQCPSFIGKLAGATAHTLAQTDLFTAYGLASNASGYWYVDYDEATAGHKSVTVVRLVDAVGTSDGKVEFVLNLYGNPFVD